MTRLTTTLPGYLSQRKVLRETLTYLTVESGRYRYLDRWGVSTGDEAVGPARGIQVVRDTEEGWADEGRVTVQVHLLTGTSMEPHRIPVAVLLDSPDDVQDFLEQYAPEVFQTTEQWEQEQREAPLSVVARHPEDDA